MLNLHLQNKVLNIKNYNNDCYSSIIIELKHDFSNRESFSITLSCTIQF